MTAEQLLFLAGAILTLGAGIMVVTMKNLFHAALAMMVSFFGVAILYISLEAGFLAAAQLLVYIGAISILIIFAIMLTRRMMQVQESPFNSQRGAGLFTAVISFIVISVVVTRFWGAGQLAEVFSQPPEIPAEGMDQMVVQLGFDLVSPNAYVIPFLVASMLLLAALIGAIYVAWPQVEEES